MQIEQLDTTYYFNDSKHRGKMALSCSKKIISVIKRNNIICKNKFATYTYVLSTQHKKAQRNKNL